MILFFVLLLVLVGFVLQKWMIVHGLQGVQSTYRPEENIVDAGDVFFILIEIENHSKWPIPYVKVKMYFDVHAADCVLQKSYSNAYRLLLLMFKAARKVIFLMVK